jgi:Na+-driven multidrug efflux pump
MSHGLVDFVLNLGITVIFVVNNNLLTSYGALSVYGSEIPLATYGIMQKIDHIMTSIATGMAQGAQPVIGYSFGRGNIKRVKEAVRFTLIQGCVIGIVLEFFALVFANQILLLFGSESDLYMEFGVKCIRIFMSLSFMFAIQTTASNIFMAMGRAVKGAVLAFVRNALVPVCSGLILCTIIGVEGVLFEGPLAGLVGFVLVCILMTHEWKQLNKML